jgi:site-specific DNA-methyltransferase (adenine-specific)
MKHLFKMKLTDKITITNEDNMELMARYPDNYFDLAIVDPPYGLGKAVVNSGGRFKKYENKNGNWDMNTPDEEYFKELFRVSKNQIIWGGNYFNLPPNKCFLIWDKGQPEGISFAMAEYAWLSFDKVAQIFKKRTQGQEERFHPTQKPVYLYAYCLEKFAQQGDKILDTHLGSGSIAIACHDYGFDLTACELDAEYYEKAIQRIKNHTNQQKLF